MSMLIQPSSIDPEARQAFQRLQTQISELGKQLRAFQEERVIDLLVAQAVLTALPAEISLNQGLVFKTIEEAKMDGWPVNVKEKALKRAEGLLFMRESMMHRVASGKL